MPCSGARILTQARRGTHDRELTDARALGLVVPRFLNQSKMILLAAAGPSVTSTIENGFVHLPDKAAGLDEYVHELAGFPKGKYDDQADSTSQALDWFKQSSMESQFGVLDLLKDEI